MIRFNKDKIKTADYLKVLAAYKQYESDFAADDTAEKKHLKQIIEKVDKGKITLY